MYIETTANKEYQRIYRPDFDFRDVSAGKGIHSIHSYPAMFHPMLVNQLIEMYSERGDLVFDPFVGSGVTAVEASVIERQFVGIDINPLAVLITKVRTTSLNKLELEKYFDKVNNNYQNAEPENPSFMNVNFWFTETRIQELSKLKKAIFQIDDENIKNFFFICLSETIRVVSNTKPNEFKLVRRKKACAESTFDVFRSKFDKNLSALETFYQDKELKYPPLIFNKNLLMDNLEIVQPESVDLLITSPPYGDSKTTVAYDQFSRLSSQWLELPYQKNKKSLGAKRKTIMKTVIPSFELYEVLSKIENQDIKRAEEVFAFYLDLFSSFKKMYSYVKNGGYFIIVVGNRTVKSIQLPTDVICNEMLEALGAEYETTFTRKILNKRMPAKNSPTNIKGKKSSTMKDEYIVILRKN